MAAALTYRTVFGMIPVIVVGLVVVRVFLATDEDVADLIRQALRFAGLSVIAVSEPLVGPFPEGEPPVPPAAAYLEEWILTLVRKVNAINFKAVGLASLGVLIYAAIAMMVEIERAFNQVCGVVAGRSWAQRVARYWTLLTLGTTGLVATFWLGQRFTGVLSSAEWLGSGQATLVIASGYVTTVAISTLLFLLAYALMPNVRLRLMPALAGAALAAVLWEAGKWGFTQYLHFSRGLTRLYGSLALIPLFLLWVYLTWLIVLMGLEVACRLDGRSGAESETAGGEIVDPALTFVVMRLAANAFDAGQVLEAEEVARRAQVSHAAARRVLHALADAGLLLRVQTGSRRGESFTLAGPLQNIDAERVLTVGERLAAERGGALIPACVIEARHACVRGQSLARVLEDVRADAGPPPAPVTEPGIPAGATP